MKFLSLCALATSIGCATAQPFAISEPQRTLFLETIRDAEAAGAAEGPPRATELLAEAKSGFEYSQRIPLYPDRARVLLAKAQADASQARELAQAAARARAAARDAAHHQLIAGAVAP